MLREHANDAGSSYTYLGETCLLAEDKKEVRVCAPGAKLHEQNCLCMSCSFINAGYTHMQSSRSSVHIT